MAIVATKDKGTQIMDGLLLSQYKDSPNLRAYLLAYVEEMDLLFQSIEEVHFGRMLEHAVGAQLNIIGEILDQSRNVILPSIYFGFAGATFDGMADEATPTVGGIFLSEDQSGLSATPLSDNEYRRVLTCKGSILSSNDLSIETMYSAFITLIGFVPDTIEISVVAPKKLLLTLSLSDITARERQLIHYMAERYLVPEATTFNTTLI